MHVTITAPGHGPPLWEKLLADLAPHLLWGLLILAVLVYIGPSRVREMLLNARKLSFAGIEIELGQDLAVAARAKNITLPPRLGAELARRAQRLQLVAAGTRLLWIDDDPDGNLNEIRLFNRLGITIDLATGDGEARALLRHAVYDLVISDLTRHHDPDAGVKFLPQLASAMLSPAVIFYVARTRDTPQGAFGLTTRPDELLRLVLDALEQRKG